MEVKARKKIGERIIRLRQEQPTVRQKNFLIARKVSCMVTDLPIEKQYARYGTPMAL